MSKMNNITFPDFPPDITQQIVPRTKGHLATGGAFSDIWCCTYHHPLGPKQVAVKAFRLFVREPVSAHRQICFDICRELEIWGRLIHPNVLPFLGITTGFGPFIALVSEWMPNGTLHQFLIQSDATMTIKRRLQLLVDISSGLEYLHSVPVIHGDLTPSNILIDETKTARLSGFGLSTVPERITERFPCLRADLDFRDPVTIRFMPPELVQEGREIGTAMDIFSFGCIGLLVLSGRMPWSEFYRAAPIVLSLYQGGAPARPSSKPIDDVYWKFLECCWLEAKDRPSASSVFLAFYSFLNSLPASNTLKLN